MTKILFFDIESGLHADFTPLVTFGYQWEDNRRDDHETHTITPIDFDGNYREFLLEVHRILSSADTWVTYFGKGFDLKMLNSYFLEAGLEPLPPIQHVDLYFTVRNNLLLHSHRLENVARFLGCPYEKTDILPRTWRAAFAGEREAVEYIRDHCLRDVQILAWIYPKLRPFVRLHPRVGEIGACRFCGTDALQRRGYNITKNGRKQRVQCVACGAWDTRTEREEAYAATD